MNDHELLISISKDIENIKEFIVEIKEKHAHCDERYVTRREFLFVKAGVFAGIGLIASFGLIMLTAQLTKAW